MNGLGKAIDQLPTELFHDDWKDQLYCSSVQSGLPAIQTRESGMSDTDTYIYTDTYNSVFIKVNLQHGWANVLDALLL